MDMFVVQGNCRLSGQVTVDGSKNAALPIMAACLAIPHQVTLHQVPRLVDVATMSRLLTSLGATIQRLPSDEMLIDSSDTQDCLARYELVRQMRAGICVLGPLLARFGRACVSLPGGCNIGHRPVDLHLKGMAALGADISVRQGYIVAEARRLKGATIDLSGPFGSTVTGTCNVMTAASVAAGQTVIQHAACEPEVVDLGQFLNSAGAQIRGLGTNEITIEGVEGLHATTHHIIPDRIEAATLAIAAAITQGHLQIHHAPIDQMTEILAALQSMGLHLETSDRTLTVGVTRPLTPVDITTAPYPGIPTDVQAQFMALLCTLQGNSRVTDRIFPDRFMHAAELLRMGADIRCQHGTASIQGTRQLSGASVMASDLRASAALVLAALAADSETQIRRIYHLDRGYVSLEKKLNSVGAGISRVSDSQASSAEPPPPHLFRRESRRTATTPGPLQDN
jgi:UDP-N-acetylglucosamine 1-carboxyvinyltransferase